METRTFLASHSSLSDSPFSFKIPSEVAMRRIHSAVAASLDGYIAGPNGESDWIIADPEIDFGALFNQFDTTLIGRRTYEMVLNSGFGLPPRMKAYVVSRTLKPRGHRRITGVWGRLEETLAALRTGPGKDIWLFGGGPLFRSLSEAGLSICRSRDHPRPSVAGFRSYLHPHGGSR
jgi:dihydrofolate reductase